MSVQIRIEGARGCGYRKPGGLYLMGPPLGASCCKLPHQLDVCPCCGAGIKPTRGWTWVDAGKLFGEAKCKSPYQESSSDWPLKKMCPLEHPNKLGKTGLLWIGEAFYKTPSDFLVEARNMGISRRIITIPNGFKLDETWVLLAHRKVIPYEVQVENGLPGVTETKYNPAIFSVFRPHAIEYVVKGDESKEELEKMASRGITPVQVQNRVAYKTDK